MDINRLVQLELITSNNDNKRVVVASPFERKQH